MKINVLGTEYTLIEAIEAQDPKLEGIDGYCDTSIKQCVIDAMTNQTQKTKGDLQAYKKAVIRHELIHAFLFESGLDSCCHWARDEEMVDWLANQFPKLLEAFKAADVI